MALPSAREVTIDASESMTVFERLFWPNSSTVEQTERRKQSWLRK
jgi:hypothetical protein